MALVPQDPGQYYRMGSLRSPSLNVPRSGVQEGQGWGYFNQGISAGIGNLFKNMNQEMQQQDIASAIQLAEKGDYRKLRKYPQLYQQFKKAQAEMNADYLDRAGQASKYLQQGMATAATSQNPRDVVSLMVNNLRMNYNRPSDNKNYRAGAGDAALMGALKSLDIDPTQPDLIDNLTNKVESFKKMDPKQTYTWHNPQTKEKFTGTIQDAWKRGVSNPMGFGMEGWSRIEPEKETKAERFVPYTMYGPNGEQVKIRNQEMADKYQGMNYKEVKPAPDKETKDKALTKARLIVDLLTQLRIAKEGGEDMKTVAQTLTNELKKMDVNVTEEDLKEGSVWGNIWDAVKKKLGVSDEDVKETKKTTKDVPVEIRGYLAETQKDHKTRKITDNKTGQTWTIEYDPMSESAVLK